jgi:hypothetical protein
VGSASGAERASRGQRCGRTWIRRAPAFDDRDAAYDSVMAAEPKGRAWTPEEVRREDQAQRARVRRDAARGVTPNLRDAVAHTEFAKRFADAFKRARRA